MIRIAHHNNINVYVIVFQKDTIFISKMSSMYYAINWHDRIIREAASWACHGQAWYASVAITATNTHDRVFKAYTEVVEAHYTTMIVNIYECLSAVMHCPRMCLNSSCGGVRCRKAPERIFSCSYYVVEIGRDVQGVRPSYNSDDILTKWLALTYPLYM